MFYSSDRAEKPTRDGKVTMDPSNDPQRTHTTISTSGSRPKSLSEEQKHRHQDAFVPTTGTMPDRLGRGLTTGKGFFAALVAFGAWYVVVCSITIGVGMLVFHVLAHTWVGTTERSFQLWLVHHGTKFISSLSAVPSFLGGVQGVVPVVLIVTIILLFRRWGRRSFILMAALLVELVVFLTANQVVRRPRPAIRHLGVTPPTFSFPSGHMAATVALYGGIVVVTYVATTRRWPRVGAWLLALVMTLTVGLSRMYRGDHFPTDVLAGLLVGLTALYVGIFIIRTLCATQLALGSHPRSRETMQSHDEKLRAD